MNRSFRLFSGLTGIALSLTILCHAPRGQADPPRTAPFGGNVVAPASRGSCPDSLPLVALVKPTPSAIAGKWNILGKMTPDHPNVWFYIPYGKSVKSTTKFRLEDQQGKSISGADQTIWPPQKPGFISVAIASKQTLASELKFGQYYQWQLTLDCGYKKVVSGWIQWTQIDPESQKKLATATDPQKAAIYNQKGIWYDTIDLLAQQRQHVTPTPALNWEQFLTENWLAAATEPAVENETTPPTKPPKDPEEIRKRIREELSRVIKAAIVGE